MLIINLVLLILSLFFMLRNMWTFNIRNKTREIVSNYCFYLIENGNYDINVNYFEEMRYSYDYFLFNIKHWNYIYCIKEEYRDTIKEFLKHQQNKKG